MIGLECVCCVFVMQILLERIRTGNDQGDYTTRRHYCVRLASTLIDSQSTSIIFVCINTVAERITRTRTCALAHTHAHHILQPAHESTTEIEFRNRIMSNWTFVEKDVLDVIHVNLFKRRRSPWSAIFFLLQ